MIARSRVCDEFRRFVLDDLLESAAAMAAGLQAGQGTKGRAFPLARQMGVARQGRPIATVVRESSRHVAFVASISGVRECVTSSM